MRFTRFAFVCAVVAACARDEVSSDASAVTLQNVSCSTCRIEADSIAYIGDPRDPRIARLVPANDSRGRFYVPLRLESSALAVLAPDGHWIETINKSDSVPVVKEVVTEVAVGPGDTLFLIFANKVRVLSPEYKFVREFPFVHDGFMNFDPLMMLAGEVPRNAVLGRGDLFRAGRRSAFSVVSGVGGQRREGQLEGQDTAKCSACWPRIFRAGVEAGTVWSSAPNQYVVDQHDADGKLLRRIVRKADWFREGVSEPDPRASSEEVLAMMLRPRFVGVRQTSDGLLWTHSYVSNPDNPLKIDFIKAVENMTGAGSFGGDLDQELILHLATRIEVIDPSTNKLLASQLIPGVVRPLHGDLSAIAVRDNVSGDSWKIVRLTLSGR